MTPFSLIVTLLALSSAAYWFGRRRAIASVGPSRPTSVLHSRPTYHGTLMALWCALPALVVVSLWLLFEAHIITGLVVNALPESLQALPPERLGLLLNDVRNVAAGNTFGGTPEPAISAAAVHYNALYARSADMLTGAALSIAVLGALWLRQRIDVQLRARNHVESAITIFLVASSLLAIVTTVGIVLSVLFEAARFFESVPPLDFLFGLEWSPQTAIREDQVGSTGAFGAVPLFAGTLLISFIAMVVAVPIGLMSAIYLAEYATPRLRNTAKPLLEILAGVPTVVYGFFAALVVAPQIRGFGQSLGLEVSSESALAAGLVMGVMIIPFVSSLSDDAITAVPQGLRDGAYGLGATRSETIRQVVIPAALPGIVGGVLLAVSRAIGETMIVVMAAGLSANLTANPLQAVTTVTVQIVTLLVGDQEFDSPKTLAAFALGLVLFVVTLLLNVIALHVVRRYREQYE
ncbi:MAG: phosphate ABC transporter permease subunit PstC [Pseudomonadota bacterium]